MRRRGGGRRVAPRVATGVGVAAIGAVAAVSLLVDYAGIVTAARDTVIDQGDYGLGARFAVFREGLAPGLPQLAVLWPVAGALAALGCILALRWPLGEERAGDPTAPSLLP